MHDCVPKWTRITLLLAAVYNITWGTWVIFWPNALFQILKIEQPVYPIIWQAVGMIVAVYGLGYGIASVDPFRHWPIVFVGLVGKILGPFGFALALSQGTLPAGFFWQILCNDLVWWIPFGLILYLAIYWNSDPIRGGQRLTMQTAIEEYESQRGQNLRQLSQDRPAMIVFLRHGGCTFCRQTLADLRAIRDEATSIGVEVVIVHMGTALEGTLMLSKYDLDFFHHLSDPDCRLYRLFGLERGHVKQLFSWKVLYQGFRAAIHGGHGIGSLQGDGFQLPGVFVMQRGKVVLAFPAQDAAERFDFLAIAKRAESLAKEQQFELALD